MLASVQHFIQAKALLQPTDKIIVAVSGGIDSVVLLHSLHQLGYPLAVAHCNYQLRGEESEGDEAFVKQLAQSLEIPLYCTRFETAAIAKENHESIQMVARRLRYDWFAELMEELSANYVATAHHLNDSLETVLFNFTKGTGIAGLTGIAAKVGQVIRPLMGTTKAEIEQFAEEQQLHWREDSSNDSTKYHRNKIRHQVLPVLKNINPNFEQTGIHTLEKLEAVQAIVDQEIYQFERRVFKEHPNDWSIPIPLLKKEEHLSFKLFESLKKYGFNYTQITDLAQNLDRLTGKKFESATHLLYIDRDRLLLVEHQEKPQVVQASMQETAHEMHWNGLQFSIERYDREAYTISKSAHIAGLDFDLLKFPLTLRLWEQGDSFSPLGMKGKKKKVSDFLIDEKVPLHLKEQVAVLESDGEIVWVIGYRIADRYKISKQTERVFVITMETAH